MTILYPAPAPVKSTRRFAAGLFASKPTYQAPCTSDDTSWWAAQLAAVAERDSHLDQMALEAEAVERLCQGLCC
jgi:hypothetical protein